MRFETWGIEGSIGHKIVEKVARLSGSYLTRITAGIKKFSEICHFLSNIQELHLMDYCVNEYNFDLSDCQCLYDNWQVIVSWLLSHGDKITNFQLHMEHTYFEEEDFVRFLGKMKTLKSFGLHNCENLLDWSGTFLLELPFDSMEKIILYTRDYLLFESNLVLLVSSFSRFISTC